MARRRWIADEASGDRAALVGPHADHLSRVLRARVGAEFDIVVSGHVRRGRISNITSQRVEFDLGDEVPVPRLPSVSVLLAVFKFDRMEWAIEKCTELGVLRILPVIAQRTDSHLASAAQKRVDRWRRIAVDASQQSRRSSPIEILFPVKLRDALHPEATSRIILSESETTTMLNDVVPSSGSIALAVGPEGGWTEQELTQFRDAGWTSASLGGTILRAETAAIAALAVVMAHRPRQ